MRPIINAIKHYVNIENANTAATTARTIDIVHAVSQSAAGAATDEVLEGSIIKAVMLELWGKSNAGAGDDMKFQLVLEKVPAGATSITFAQMNNLMAYVNKKNIFYVTQGVMGDQTTASMALIRGWFKVPKGKQRFGLDDRLVITVAATTANLNNCGFATYKEYK